MTTKSLKSAIMRRVWRHFAWSIVTNRGLIPGLAFGVSIQLFRELVFVERVLESLLATEVGQVPSFVYSVLINADTASLLTIAVMVSSAWLFYRYIVTSGLKSQVIWMDHNRLSAS